MHFSYIITLILTLLTIHIMANTITFFNTGNNVRIIAFTANAGFDSLPSFNLPGHSTYTMNFPSGWQGMFKALSSDMDPLTRLTIGEITFQGAYDLTYYDVSAVDNCCDSSGIKKLAVPGGSISGCDTFPCADSYTKPQDVQTKTHTATDLNCVVGGTSAGVPL